MGTARFRVKVPTPLALHLSFYGMQITQACRIFKNSVPGLNYLHISAEICCGKPSRCVYNNRRETTVEHPEKLTGTGEWSYG
jgi:hypothetical protein